MNKAEEYYREENKLWHIVLSNKQLKDIKQLEAYHQSEVTGTDWINRLKAKYFEKGLQAKLESRVNTISDDEIVKISKEYSNSLTHQIEFVRCVKWAFEKAIKQ